MDWAVDHDFAVIDVNLPRHITSDENDEQLHEEANAIENRAKEAAQLLTYLWDNYIELNEATHVFLMGTNTGHGAIINWIKANEERAQEVLTKTISFVEDVPLQSCKSSTNDGLASWYYNTSLVFVAQEHAFWTSDFAKKIRKRFGRLFKSSEDSMSEMLHKHRAQIFGALYEETKIWRSNQPVSDDEDDTTAGHMPPVSNVAPSFPRTDGNTNHNNSPKISNMNHFVVPGSREERATPPVSNFATSPRQTPGQELDPGMRPERR